MSVVLSGHQLASTMPIVTDELQAAWRETGWGYRGGAVYQSLSDGSLAYEADHERLVSLPDDLESIILDVMLLDQLTERLGVSYGTGEAN